MCGDCQILKKIPEGRVFIWLVAFCVVSAGPAAAQGEIRLSIDSCHAMAKRNYPLIKRFDLVKKSSEFTISNANKAYLPQLSLTGIGAYVFKGLPTVPGAEENKWQWIGIAQFNQTIWDGGETKSQKKITRAGEQVEENNVAVLLYGIRDRVNQLYFGILLIDAQLAQLDILTDRYRISLGKARELQRNGYAYESDVNEIKAEILNIEQRRIEMDQNRAKYVEMLSYFVGRPLTDSIRLQKPLGEWPVPEATNNRPELRLFDSQRRLADAELSRIRVNSMPKIGVLGLGALVQPGLNFGQSKITSLALGGLSVSWNLGGLYRNANNKDLNQIQHQKIDNDEEVFRFNNNLELKQHAKDIESQSAVLMKDEEIIALKNAITKSYQLKYDNGLCSMSDLITAMNKEAEAKNNRAQHELQRAFSIYKYSIASGN